VLLVAGFSELCGSNKRTTPGLLTYVDNRVRISFLKEQVDIKI